MKETIPIVAMFAAVAVAHVVAWRKGKTTGKQAAWACGVLAFCSLVLLAMAR